MKRLLFLLLAVVTMLPINAQIKGNNIVVTVEPDHEDWNYRVGETAKFTVEVRRSGTLVSDVSIDYTTGPEMYQDTKKTVTLKDGTLKLTGKMASPGFYRVDVTAHVGGKDYRGACAAAFSPEKLQPTTVMPKDFSEYWQDAIQQARHVDLNPTKRLLPERCTKDVNVYEVSFQNMQWNWRTYGILCVPVKEGKYPALLRVPGAGVRPYEGDVYTASQGVITLEIGIHGISVTMQQKVYDDVFNGALMNYWNFGMDNRDDSYYKRVIIGCIRALDYIEQYTPWNGGWPHYFYWNKGKGQEQKIETSRYYDGVNFARLINDNQKGWFSFGYCDDVVPPTTAWATYNTVTGPKEISPYQATWHFWFQEQWDEWESWLLRELRK